MPDAALLLEAARTYRIALGSLADAIVNLLKTGECWAGTPRELLAAVAARKPATQDVLGGWPQTSRGLSGHLTRITPQLRGRGIRIDRPCAGGATILRLTQFKYPPQVRGPGSRAIAERRRHAAIHVSADRDFPADRRWRQEVLGLRVEDVSLDRKTVTFRPHEQRR